MDYFIFSIKDTASQAFAQPFYAPAEAVAIRSVRDMVNAAGDSNAIAKHPEDYELWHLGMFSDHSGEIDAGSSRLVCRCKDLLKPVN